MSEPHVFDVRAPEDGSAITFKSTAPLEDIVGTTDQIDGQLSFNPENPRGDISGEITVPVASLNTGIPLRDEDLRSPDWLDAKTYPDITLNITGAKKLAEIKSGDNFQTYGIVLVGELTLHGHAKKIEIAGRFTYLQDREMIAARASFEIALADFGIVGPKNMRMIGVKVGKTISVEVALRAHRVTTGNIVEGT